MSRFEIQTSVPGVACNAIDWAHLDQATMGDRKLADEVLGLFDTQAAECASALREAPQNTAPLLHKLKGSARGIGAWPVAETAKSLEEALTAGLDPSPAVTALLTQIAAARGTITDRLCKA